jgi:hypothetical protein
VRIVLSYIPFKRSIADDELSYQFNNLGFSDQLQNVAGAHRREGLYDQEEGKAIEHKDRLADQEEIKGFLIKVFSAKSELSFEDYVHFNKQVSSEMFFSIMSVLHERLPCAPNFFRLKKIFRSKISLGAQIIRKSQSPSRTIASPSMMKGLSTFKKDKFSHIEPLTPTIYIKNKILNEDRKR